MSTFVQLLYGPMLLGVMLNILLYGIMVTQTYLYFSMYEHDHLWLKVFVLVLFAFDTLNTALDIATVYVPLINQFGDFEALTSATWMFASDSVMTATIAALVQFFFAWRLKVLTSNNWLVGVIAVCAIIQLLLILPYTARVSASASSPPPVSGIGCTITLAIEPSFDGVRRFRYIGIIWSVTMAFTDVLIAAALVRYLWKHKTGVAATDNMINKIIRLTVQTGFITAFFAVTTVILYLTLSSGYDLLFHLPLAKLYTNSLMSTLNSRRMWMADFCKPDSMNMSFSTDTGGRCQLRSRSGHHGTVRANVNLDGSDGRGGTRDPDRIVIGVESHQVTDLISDVNLNVKDGDSDDHSTRSFVPELAEKKTGMSAAEAAV